MIILGKGGGSRWESPNSNRGRIKQTARVLFATRGGKKRRQAVKTLYAPIKKWRCSIGCEWTVMQKRNEFAAFYSASAFVAGCGDDREKRDEPVSRPVARNERVSYYRM